jgi:serine/threonine-protein kinase
MGLVYAAQDLRLGRAVAVKLLRRELAADPRTCRRFEREARMAARVSDPHIVAIYDVGGDDDVPFIVMERLGGRSLADEIAAGPLSGWRLSQIAQEVLTALAAAHRRGVVHRDVKPSNVLLTSDGHTKVADFGIAKATNDASDTTALLGTAAYVAPERLAGHPATPQSDVFSLGVVLYEAATGSKPFKADSPLGTVHAIAHEQPRPLAVLRPDLAPGFIAAVEHAMDKDPTKRFESAADMATALRMADPSNAVGHDETIPLTDDPSTAILPPVLRPDATRRGAAAPGAGHVSRLFRISIAVAVLLLAGVVLVTWAASRGSNSPATPTTTRPAVVASTLPTTRAPTPTTRPTREQPTKGRGKGNGHSKNK